jgi:hypothetical protein
MKELIEVRQNGNRIRIPGVDELADSLIFLNAIPEDNVHRGIHRWTKVHIEEIANELDLAQDVHFDGHSMGGSASIETARQLAILYSDTNFYVEAQAPFPCYTKRVKKPSNLHLNIREFGNDPITSLPFWFTHLDAVNHEGPRRTFFGPFIQLFHMNDGDHLGYWPE